MLEENQNSGETIDVMSPSLERQAELEAAHQANVEKGDAPYAGVEIKTRGEVLWIMQQFGWRGDGAAFHDTSLRANFAYARFSYDVNLSSIQLECANLSYTELISADLSNAHLDNAVFDYALLFGANFSGAYLTGCSFVDADMSATNLGGVFLENANLSGANLGESRMNLDTVLWTSTKFDKRTQLVDVRWNNAPLARVPWDQVSVLGDETEAREPIQEHDGKPKSKVLRIGEFVAAARAYRQLAVALRSQGMNEDADRYAYRAQLMQREVYRWSRHWGGFLFSWFLFLISGYGYRLRRILATYALVLVSLALVYLLFGVHALPHEAGIRELWDSFLVSLSAIHGRTTFEQLGAWSPAAWAAAVESVFGIVIEGVFVAMLIQRFFAR